MTRAIQQTELGAEIQCSKCGEFLPADREFFAPHTRGKFGCSSWCKGCIAVRARQWRAEHKKGAK